MKRIISVIIPTKNRQLYAQRTVNQVLALDNDIEVIVHDNSDNDTLYTLIKDRIDNDRLKYAYEKEALSFSENYNRAAELADGDYFCAIGDDDGVLPNIVECAKWMGNNGIDIVKPSKDQVYFYPGNINKKKNACLGFGNYTGSFFYSNPETSVIALLDDGGCNYLDKNLAGSYHGLVDMRIMNKVRDITGKYYSGLTPDMYSVICLSLLPHLKFAILDYPITLPGVCPLSGSAASDSGKHIGQLQDAPHLKALPDYKWSDLVPRYYSVETIWAETMIYAIHQMGRDELIEKYYNPDRLAMFLYINNKSNREEILNSLQETTRRRVLDFCGKDMENRINRISLLLGNASIKISGKRKVIRRVEDIRVAVDVLYDKLSKMGIDAPWDR